MVDIQTQHGRNGTRTYITLGHKRVVLDGNLQEPGLRTGRFVNDYMYGT